MKSDSETPMPSTLQPVVKFFKRIQRRLEGGRPGSVLILTVVMVVLLALLGTALLTTTRNDRWVSTQNATNTQLDMLFEMAKTAVQADMLSDIRGSSGDLRPSYNTSADTTQVTPQAPGQPLPPQRQYTFDGPLLLQDAADSGVPNDFWLASSAPILSGRINGTGT